MVRYPDTQQLFVGNVPHDVDKMELKEFFERKTFELFLPDWDRSEAAAAVPPPLGHFIG